MIIIIKGKERTAFWQSFPEWGWGEGERGGWGEGERGRCLESIVNTKKYTIVLSIFPSVIYV
ncbi:MAG: hypothetical protein F6K58_32790 [Symploca sp. SIO2E9]|nr:hypothetical protein [Symploca sp. SIO2E9]